MRKVLIVDDEYLTTKLLQTLLELEGFATIATSDRQQAVEMVRADWRQRLPAQALYPCSASRGYPRSLERMRGESDR